MKCFFNTGFLGILLISHLTWITIAQQISSEVIENIAEKISNLFEAGTGYSHYQDYVDDLEYEDPVSVSLSDVTDIAQDINGRLVARRRELLDLKQAIENQYASSTLSSNIPDYLPHCSTVSLEDDVSYLHNTQVNRDEWCAEGKGLENDVEKEFLPMAIKGLMKGVVDTEQNAIKRVYFGSEQGVLFTYPASRLCKERNCDYDPRFEHWYVATATLKPKDVVILIDKSGSMGNQINNGDKTIIEVAQEAASTVLLTLNPNDRAVAIAFNSEVEVPDGESCYSSQLSKATPDNIEKLNNFITRISPGSDTKYSNGLEKAFEYFANTETELIDERERDRVLLLMTDGAEDLNENVSDIYETIRRGNALVNNEVVIMTYAIGSSQATEMLQNITRQAFYDPTRGEVTPGRFTEVTNADLANLRYELGSYYNFFKPVEVNQVQLTVPNWDNFDTGLQISLCTQVRGGSSLKGIVCLDQPLEDIVNRITYYRRGNLNYGFIIDSQTTIVLTHPLLPNPDTVERNVRFTHIRTLEQSNIIDELIAKLQSGETGALNISSRRVAARGDVNTEGVSYYTDDSTYTFAPITDFDLSVCIVSAQSSRTYALSSINWAVNYPEFVYHANPSDANTCRAATREALKDKGSIKLAPGVFTNNLAYLTHDEDENDFRQYQEYFTAVNSNSDSIFQRGTREVAAMMNRLNSLWQSRNNYADNIIWRYFATYHGVHFTFPGIKLPKLYDPTLRSWFLRQVEYRNSIVVTSPYEDAFGAGTVLSLTRAILNNNDAQSSNTKLPVTGVMGLDLSLIYTYHLITEDIGECQSEQNTCFVIDKAGFIVVHEKWLRFPSQIVESVHFTFYEEEIASALKELNIWRQNTQNTCIKTNNIRSQQFGKISLSGSSHDGGWFEIHEIGGTNIYFIMKKGIVGETEECHCAYNSGNDILFSPGDCRGTVDDCVCPCYRPVNDNEYDECGGYFILGSDSPPPCTPPAPSIDWKEASLRDNTSGLEYCHAYKCHEKMTEKDCLSTLSCNWCLSDVEDMCNPPPNSHVCKREILCTRPPNSDNGGDCNTDSSLERIASEEGTTKDGEGSFPMWAIGIIVVILVLACVVAVGAYMVVKHLRRDNTTNMVPDNQDMGLYDDLNAFPHQQSVGMHHMPHLTQEQKPRQIPMQHNAHINRGHYITTGVMPDVAYHARHGQASSSGDSEPTHAQNAYIVPVNYGSQQGIINPSMLQPVEANVANNGNEFCVPPQEPPPADDEPQGLQGPGPAQQGLGNTSYQN